MIITIAVFVVILILGSKGIWERRLFIVLAALSLAICGISVFTTLTGAETKISSVSRGAAGSGPQSVELKAQRGDEVPLNVNIVVPAMEYTDEEAGEILDDMLGKMDLLIIGDNESFSEVRHALVLRQYYEGYKAAVQWRSGALSVISTDGTIGKAASEDGSTVVIKAVLSLGNCERLYEKEITVYPSEDLTVSEQIQNAAETLNEGNESSEYLLPESMGGESISWSSNKGTDWQNLSVVMLVIGILLYFVKREKEKEKKKKRLEELERAYPELLSRLLLLLHAGLTCRKAFTYLDESSRRQKKKGNTLSGSAALEEVSLTCLDMSKGVSEGDAYRRFAERCVLPCYKNLAVLLEQNLKKGGAGLINLLEQEAVIAFEDRKRMARIKGEQTSIKLLFPMIMMLAVVMIIMIVPAFMTF